MELLDWQDGIARVVNNRTLYVRLLGYFVETQGNVMDQVKAALAADNQEEAHNLVHTLKGTAGNLGAKALWAAAEEVNAAMRNGQDFTDALVVLEDVLNRTCEAMRQFQ